MRCIPDYVANSCVLNQVLLLYYSHKAYMANPFTPWSVLCFAVLICLTPTRNIATVLAVLVGLTQQMKQGEMEELGMEEVMGSPEQVNIWSVRAGRWLGEKDIQA